MNISEFRKDISNQFNVALTQDVHIERGGITFVLRAVNYKLVDGFVNIPPITKDEPLVYTDKSSSIAHYKVKANSKHGVTKETPSVETAAQKANREIVEETRRRMGL